LVRSRFESVQPRFAKLNTRLAKKLSEHERLSIDAAIDANADQLREAVTARQRQLKQHLAQIAAAKTKNLDLMEGQDSSFLAALVQLAQDLKSLQGQDDLAVLDVYGGWLPADHQEDQVDECSIAPSRLVSELDVSMLMKAIGQWGSVSDLPPVQGVVFDRDSLGWQSLAGAVEYEVQMARVGAVGERQGDVDVEVKGDAYRRVYQGPEARCQAAFWEVGEFAVRVRARFEGEGRGWGPFSSLVTVASGLLPVRDVAYVDGVVSWSNVTGAVEYEVQIAGPIDDSKEAKADEAQYKSVYQGSGTIWAGAKLNGAGEYRFRVRAQLHGGWGPLSPPALFQYKGMEWSADQKTEGIELTSDLNGLKRMARRDGSASGYRSVLSSRPLAPPSPPSSSAPFSPSPSSPSSPPSSSPSSPSSPSSSSLSGVASFQVRVDCCGGMMVGVSRALPGAGGIVGFNEGCGVGWGSGGRVYNHGQRMRDLGSYGVGDVVGVEVDFGAHTLFFFKNGARQGDPFILSEQDRNQPLYAAVSMRDNGTLVTLL